MWQHFVFAQFLFKQTEEDSVRRLKIRLCLNSLVQFAAQNRDIKLLPKQFVIRYESAAVRIRSDPVVFTAASAAKQPLHQTAVGREAEWKGKGPALKPPN